VKKYEKYGMSAIIIMKDNEYKTIKKMLHPVINVFGIFPKNENTLNNINGKTTM
jgi:hypothetical protein